MDYLSTFVKRCHLLKRKRSYRCRRMCSQHKFASDGYSIVRLHCVSISKRHVRVQRVDSSLNCSAGYSSWFLDISVKWAEQYRFPSKTGSPHRLCRRWEQCPGEAGPICWRLMFTKWEQSFWTNDKLYRWWLRQQRKNFSSAQEWFGSRIPVKAASYVAVRRGPIATAQVNCESILHPWTFKIARLLCRQCSMKFFE